MMDAVTKLAMKRALEILDPLEGGLCAQPLFDQVERTVGRTLTDLERHRAYAWMRDKGWVRTGRHALTDEEILFVTDAGRMAMIGL